METKKEINPGDLVKVKPGEPNGQDDPDVVFRVERIERSAGRRTAICLLPPYTHPDRWTPIHIENLVKADGADVDSKLVMRRVRK